MSDRSTTRALDCGKTIDELSDYLAMDRIPFDPTIETCPECLNALHALDQIAQLSRDLLDNDAAHLPPRYFLRSRPASMLSGDSLPGSA